MSSGGAASDRVTPPRGAAEICAVVVAYHPGPEVPGHIEAILRQVARVVVVDNEASAESRARLAPWRAHPGVTLVENVENLGIATAFNQGVRLALDEGYQWIATFDQDSLVPDGYFSAMLEAHASYPDRAQVAVLVPLYRDRYLDFVFSSGGPLREPLTANVPVSVAAASGNLVAAAALRAVGGFRDDFFIGYVDFEFCLRCRQAGWQVLEVRRVILDHAMGRYQLRPWFGRKARINDYNEMRRYYNARNQIIVYARLGRVDLRWALRDAWLYSKDCLKLLLYCEDRGGKVCAILTGYWHALSGRRGRWQSPRWPVRPPSAD